MEVCVRWFRNRERAAMKDCVKKLKKGVCFINRIKIRLRDILVTQQHL